MEDRSGEEKQITPSQSVIHTYYHGDINAVVDEHFFRALNKSSMPKDLSTKRKPSRGPRPDFPISSSWSPSWSKRGLSPGSSGLIPSEEAVQPQGVIMGPLSADPWGYPGMQGSRYDVPPLYRQAAAPPSNSTSFLHLLHMDRPAGGVVITPSIKTDRQQEWPAGSSHGPGDKTHLDTGVHLEEKSKDVYWY